jgi:hypothetical protein
MSESFSQITLNGSALGTPLQTMLMADSISPGSEPGYEVCKTIYLWHPLGAKMAEAPVEMAQSQRRDIKIPHASGERLREKFEEEWDILGADAHIANLATQARVYGLSSIVYGAEGIPTNEPIDMFDLAKLNIYFSIFDPLNTSGSLVLNQEPNSPDFQKVIGIRVNGSEYHRSRACVLMNEKPIYIAFTTSAFGYVGRSVYQRALFPLKSFVQSMITDDMVTRKAGVLVATLKAPGSILDNLMQKAAGLKRELLKQAQTNNVISISTDEKVESLNLNNIDAASTAARKNILENVAVASGMPAKILNSESFVEGFGEGTEDAKDVARWVERYRRTLNSVYRFMDRIVQHRAWNEEFFDILVKEFPEEYKGKTYKQAFFEIQNSFKADWPSLLTEPDSEKVKVDETKLKAITSVVEIFASNLDPENKALLLQWAADNINESEMLFDTPLELDWDALLKFVQEQQKKQEEQAQMGGMGGPPGAGGDDEGEMPPPKKPESL